PRAWPAAPPREHGTDVSADEKSIGDILPDPEGFGVLTEAGEIAFVRDGRLQVDAEFSRIFGEHNRAFLHRYLAAPRAANGRLGIVVRHSERQSWSSPTLLLDDETLRQLYPVSGRPTDELTAFQRKHRTQSIYRSMETLLERRHELAPLAPVYCPLLYCRHTTLPDYPELLARDTEPACVPVIEIVNLFAGIPLVQRTAEPMCALVDRLHRGVVRKSRRQDSRLGVLQAGVFRQNSPAAITQDPYAQLARDRRFDRKVTLPAIDTSVLHRRERFESVERWLRYPQQNVETRRLRQFRQFRELDETVLARFAEESPVYTAPGGTRLFECGQRDAWNLYLLEGVLMLTATDGATLRIEGGSEPAASPVAFLKPRKYTVETLTPVSFLWVHDLQLSALTSGRGGETGPDDGLRIGVPVRKNG
ncbi:MAG: hypothetical protein OEV31_08020, partial [Gammaproteobacteria bacterium]|nr:hypothetical protein [Gammaproteobacteria bacterium]